MKQLGTLFFVIVYFLHLLLGAGAGYAALGLWPQRSNPLIGRLILYMQAAVIGVVLPILLVFMARGVTLTWTFTITWFVATLLMDVVRLPLVVYLIKPKAKE